MFKRSTHVVFFVFLLASMVTGAQPIPLMDSVSVSPRQLGETLPTAVIDGKKYHLQFILPALNERRRTTGIYQMTELFDERGALVMITKRLNETGASERLKKEVLYAKAAKIYLFHQSDNTYDYLVIKEDYPGKMRVPLKFFHEWYLEDRHMKAEKGLYDLRALIRRKLPKMTDVIGLTNPNIYLWSVLTDRRFEKLVFIDWSPAANVSAGVEAMGDHKKLDNFYDDMERFLPRRFSVKTLESVLNTVGTNLREADGGPMTSINLDGHHYKIKLLSRARQGTKFTYEISQDFLREGKDPAPALLKVISHYGNYPKAAIRKEIKYLTEVGLYLFSGSDNVAFYIVTRNVRKGVRPLKPYHEWHLEDRSRDVDKDLKELQTNVKEKLIRYAERGQLCYQDIHFLNIYVDKTLQNVMPIDWEPGDDRVWGVEDIANSGDKGLKECKKFISEKVEAMLNRAELEDVLQTRKSNNKLRP